MSNFNTKSESWFPPLYGTYRPKGTSVDRVKLFWNQVGDNRVTGGERWGVITPWIFNLCVHMWMGEGLIFSQGGTPGGYCHPLNQLTFNNYIYKHLIFSLENGWFILLAYLCKIYSVQCAASFEKKLKNNGGGCNFTLHHAYQCYWNGSLFSSLNWVFKFKRPRWPCPFVFHLVPPSHPSAPSHKKIRQNASLTRCRHRSSL